MSNKLTQAVLPLILLFSSGVWTAEETLDITLPAWSTDSVYGDNTVYEINLTQTALTSTSETGVNTNKLGGVYFEPFAKIPSPWINAVMIMTVIIIWIFQVFGFNRFNVGAERYL